MKTLLLFIAVLAGSIVNAQNVNIPDANFKSYLVGNTLINTNADTEIQVTEAMFFFGIIDCSTMNISDLTGIEAFLNLDVLVCYQNQLTSLDVSQNTYLTELYSSSNPLTSLDVTQNAALEILGCNGTQLISLDVSQNTVLEKLYCSYNQLTSLDLSLNPALWRLICDNNQLTSLDLSLNPALYDLKCYNNQLVCLSIKNGNNFNIVGTSNISILLVNNNPNLTCLEVDNATWSSSNWNNNPPFIEIDPQTNFSIDCTAECTCISTSSSITEIALDSYTAPSGAIYTTGGVFTDTIPNAAGCDSVITIDLSMNYTGLNELNDSPKELLKIVDLTGRETPYRPNTLLVYYYSDGTVERVFKVEEW